MPNVTVSHSVALKIKDMEHSAIPPLTKQKYDIAVIHIEENDMIYRDLEHVDFDELLQNIINIGQKSVLNMVCLILLFIGF